MPSELWAIAIGERIVEGTDARSAKNAWTAFYLKKSATCGIDKFIERQRLNCYSAVRLKYEIVERDGEKPA